MIINVVAMTKMIIMMIDVVAIAVLVMAIINVIVKAINNKMMVVINITESWS